MILQLMGSNPRRKPLSYTGIMSTHLTGVVLLCMATFCHGNDQTSGQPANHLLLFDKLPDGMSTHKAPPFDVRTNFSGTVQLVESRDFRAVVNITAPTLQQAYDVQAELYSHRGRLVLEIQQQHFDNGVMALTWLVVGAAVATFLVGICTFCYVRGWYAQERQPYIEINDRRSYASSSNRGGYRQGNSIPMMPLHGGAAGGAPGAVREFGGASFGRGGLGEDGERTARCEEELRQVQEMPEEEEAEAREMEQRHKLKMMKKEEMALGSGDTTSGDVTLDSDDPHERNLIKSRFHSQAKTVHKDLLTTNKKSGSSPSSSTSAVNSINVGGSSSGVGSLGRRLLAMRRTQEGTYEGVPRSDPDDDDMRKFTDSPDSKDKDDKDTGSLRRHYSRDKMSPPPNYASAVGDESPRSSPITFSAAELQVNLGTTSGKVKAAEEPKYANDPSERDPLLILADVHKTTADTKDDKLKTSDKSQGKPTDARPGNVYVNPAQMKRVTPPKLTTFGTPVVTSTPKPRVTTQLDTDQDPWVLNTMTDIAEDPREDDQRVVSGDGGRSGKSNSMYGSSEIFPGGMDDYYENLLDSDVEVPPLDAEDSALLSDGGLPSPLGFPSLKTGDKGKVNDDIKLIPGALKSPGANVGRMVGSSTRPRPYSSFIYNPTLPLSPITPNPTSGRSASLSTNPTSAGPTAVSGQNGSHSMGNEGSPPLPPPPENLMVGGVIASIDDVSQSASSAADGSVFQFPPPPNLLQTDSTNQRAPQATLGGEYVQIKKQGVNGSQGHVNPSGRGRGGGGGGRNLIGGGTYMNIAVVCALCVLGGVYGAFRNHDDQTRVDVTIFAPKQFLGNSTRIFLNYHLDSAVKDTTLSGSNVLVFDVEQPLSDPDVDVSACINKSCDHACDEATGLCACLKGYKALDEHTCGDVNECMEGKVRCDPAAGCHNRKGTYDCICGEDFYGNGKTCRECRRPCPDKHYEVQPCAPDIQKICKACTQSCRPGYYMAQPCMTKENAICRVCKPACGPGEFETRQCSTHHDRECANVTLLQQPVTSDNLILEDRNHVTDSSAILDKLPARYVGFSNYELKRGTGIYVEIKVRFIEAAQQFVPVNETDPLYFDHGPTAPSSLKSREVLRYCPHPLPDFYRLEYQKHKGTTYKRTPNGLLESCVTNEVSNLTTATPGSEVNLGSQSPSTFYCSQPGTLTDSFGVEEEFFLARTKWVDKSKRCQRSSNECVTCIRDCGISKTTGDPSCSTTGHDNDNGYSPRLQMCYNCCVKKNCAGKCRDYHINKCQPKQCTNGNLLEFTLKPNWESSHDGQFFCHIQPLPGQYLLNLDYHVKVRGRSHDKKERGGRGRGRGRGSSRGRDKQKPMEDMVLRSEKILLYGNDDWMKTGVMKYQDGILNIVINSSLGTPPDFLEGGLYSGGNVFRLGHYRTTGTKFGNSYIKTSYTFLRPPTPHGISIMPPAKQDCSAPKLLDMLQVSTMEDPYTLRTDLVAKVENSTYPYTVRNTNDEPVVTATLSSETKILQQLYPPTRLQEESFQGDVLHNGSHWVVTLSGEITLCPGFIQVSLADPANPSKPMFSCDTAVLCPETFNLTFAIPTSDLEGMYKDILVQIKDAGHEHNFRLFRRTSVEENQEETAIARQISPATSNLLVDGPGASNIDVTGSSVDVTASRDAASLPLPIYALLIIIGVVLVLLVLAIIGQCFLSDFPTPYTPYAQFHHGFFAISYMMVQFAYSLVISGTAFFLILTVVTNRDVSFIVRHGQPGAVSTAASNIELLRLQRHLEGEITRQDMLADAAQELCLRDIHKISVDMKKIHDSLLNSTQDVFQRHRLDLLLTQQKIHVRQKLTEELIKYRDSYTKIARAVLKQVNQNALASYQNILYSNTWLDGARFLHGWVNLTRSTHRKPVKSFMEWTGINAQLEKLEIDLAFSLPALPRLDDIPSQPVKTQPIKRGSESNFPELDPIRSIQMHNNWFFPVEELGISGASAFGILNLDSDRQTNISRPTTSSVFYVFLVLFVLCDIVLLGHRMCRAWTTAKLCLYGFPEYFRENKEAEMGTDDVFASRESKLTPAHGCKESSLYQSIAFFFTQTISTTFFPKIVGAIASCVVMVCLLQFSNQYLTVKELQRVGLYHSADEYLDLQTSLTNARVTGHAAQINQLHFPAFQASVSGHVTRHQTVLQSYRKQLLGLQTLSIEMYCQHLKAIKMEANCSGVEEMTSEPERETWDKLFNLVHSCRFYPVVPRLYVRGENEGTPTSEAQIEAVLQSVRNIVFLTFRLVTIFVTVVVIKELLCAVVWIFLQRSGAIRIRVIVERDQDESMQ